MFSHKTKVQSIYLHVVLLCQKQMTQTLTYILADSFTIPFYKNNFYPNQKQIGDGKPWIQSF